MKLSKFSKLSLATAAVFAAAGSASAIPLLQLDVIPGSYDSVAEDSVPSGQSFTLRALLTPKNGGPDSNVAALLANTYYVSTAIAPDSGTPSGSFEFDGSTVLVSSLSPGGPTDLPSHGIFDTLFNETSFQFSSLQTVPAYNVDGSSPDGNDSATSYYIDFAVDTTNLDSEHSLHFDLYKYDVVQHGPNVSTQISFAPFSHDASSLPGEDGGGNPGGNVPDGGATALLLGIGAVGLGFLRSRK